MEVEQEKRNCLIVGCGYVGKPLATRLMKCQWNVAGVVKSESSLHQLASSGIPAFQGDITDGRFWSDLGEEWSHVVYCPSTGGGGVAAYREIHDVGLTYALNWAARRAQLIYTSSTSVYGQTTGELVDESSLLQPASESARELVRAERKVCTSGKIVMRLGGIYGPERGVLLKRLLEGRAMVPEQDPKWLNLIFLDDIVDAIEHGLTGHIEPGQVYNVIDDEPASYRSIYEWLCKKLDLPMPPTGTPDYFGKRGITNKRVSNQKIRHTGWRPRYPSFREGYESMLGHSLKNSG